MKGRTERNEIVHFEAPGLDPVGRVVRINIEQAFNNSLFGSLVDAADLPENGPGKWESRFVETRTTRGDVADRDAPRDPIDLGASAGADRLWASSR